MFDNATVALILAILGGPVVLAVTEMVKRLLVKWFPTLSTAVIGYAVCGASAIGGTLYLLLQTHTFTPLAFVGYSVLVFIEASGIYKALPKPE